MRSFRQLFEVARRDFVQRARSRAFLLTTLLTVGVIIAIAPLLATEFDEPPPARIGVIGEVDPDFQAVIDEVAEAVGLRAEVDAYPDLAGLELAVQKGEIAVAVTDEELLWNERVGERLRVVVVTARQSLDRALLIDELGVDPGAVASLLAPPAPGDRVLAPPEADETARLIGAQAGIFVLYMSILIFGQFVLLGVLEEKQSRVVEVVLSRIEPSKLLAGKIIGIGLLGLVQIIVIGAAIVFAVSLIDVADVALPSLSIGIAAVTAFWYLLGFAFYATIYGALGATVSRQEDAQGAVMLPALLIIPGFFIAIMSALENPDSTLAVVGSLVPLSAPMVMPVRMAMGVATWWEVVTAILLIVFTTLVVIRLAARVYQGAILSIGAKVRIRDALKAARA